MPWRSGAMLVLALVAAGCDEPPPPEPIPLGTASTSAREQIDRSTRVHGYVAAYRRVLRMELRPSEADRMLRVSVSDTDRADPRFLGFLAADRLARTLAPLALDAVGRRDEAARLRETTAVADRASARRAARVVERMRAALDRERESRRSPHPGTIDTVVLVLAETEAILAATDADAPVEPLHGERVGRALMSVLSLYPEGSSREAVVNVGIALLRDLSQAGRSVIIPADDPSYPARTVEEGS